MEGNRDIIYNKYDIFYISAKIQIGRIDYNEYLHRINMLINYINNKIASDIAMVITNSYYTENARKAAQASEVILVDRDGLQRIIDDGNMYFNSLLS